MPKVHSRTDTVFARNVFIPTQTYRVCVVKTKLGESQKKNAMTTLTCEIIEPEEVEHEGNLVKITGETFQLYLVHVDNLVGKQKQSSQASVWEFCDKTGVTELMEKDDDGTPLYIEENHEEYYLGLEFDMPLSSKERTKRMRATPEQKAKGLPGDPILDGEGKQQTEGWQIEASMQDVPPNCRPSRRSMAFQG